MFLCTELSTNFLISPSLASAKSIFLKFSMTDQKFSLIACSFLGLSSVKVKSDDEYQIRRTISSDDHCLILYRDQFYPVRAHRN